MPLSLFCFLQEKNSRSLESDYTYCLVRDAEEDRQCMMPKAHLKNPANVVFVPLGIVILVALCPVLCPIKNVFLKNVIISWLCKIEGFENICSVFHVRGSVLCLF